ncbi:PQQ-binding-like beta-propeller repeat protein [Microbacterium sp. KSW4-16]|uniref:outer membrane protein assembly factor BamB family protein n=1 Tax=Microbacterium aurugineum TaxID=2851642 RepID=UPI0020BDA737|nr:PQQ-binding-like beta-propeller repeat protein [Microbacterium aurugineum]MCK8467922.1 PQQ-binding-like beta-propeller repeat protein [Microbacterium aurugineum]
MEHTPSNRPPAETPLTRRGFLGLSAAGIAIGATAAWGPWPGAGVAAAATDDHGGRTLRFAVLTDTHANEDEATRMANLRRIFAAVEAENPQFVLHCGDITDYGSDESFSAYRDLIPSALWERVRHVPGNHEIRWDTSARRRFQHWFGPTSYGFDAGGVHFMALDPTQLLQEPGLFADDLAALEEELRGVGDRPSLLFLHYPVGGANYYVNDTDALLRTIAPFPVRGIFAGHRHLNEVDRFNGLTQVTTNAARPGPFYLRVTERHGRQGRMLVVEHMALGATDAEVPTVEALAEIPLEKPSASAETIRIAARPGPDEVALTAVAGRSAVAVDARLHPQSVFGARDERAWMPLAARGRSWHGAVDRVGVAPGIHRVQVRAVDETGGRREEWTEVELPGSTRARLAWELDIGGQLQGALIARDSTVVACSTSGHVTAVDAAGRGKPRRIWTAEAGPVHRGAAFTPDGGEVIVPSTDGRLLALDTGTGRTIWTSHFEKPVLTTPLVATTAEHGGRILVSAEDTLRCLTVDGATLWEAPVPVRTAGRAACDGERVYVGAGDGRGYAYDLHTGTVLWSVLTTDRPDRYRQLIYGPWDDWVEVLPTGAVVFSTVADAIAVDPRDGREIWRTPGSYIFAPSLPLPDGGLLLTSEWGVVTAVDQATGATRWSTQAVPRVVNAGPVIDPRTGSAWLVSVGGLLAEVRTADGAASVDRQLFTANTFSTPVLAADRLVVAAQDGVLRAFTL